MRHFYTRLFLVASLFAVVAPGLAANSTPASAESRSRQLIAVLQSNASQKEKADACRELAVVGGKEAVAPLAALLKDEKLTHMARYGLEPIPSSSVDAAFRKALTTLSGKPLAGVIYSVGVRRDTKAINKLGELVLSDDPEVAQAAGRALGAIGTAKASKALQQALPKTAAGNRLAVYEGLLRCAEKLNAAGSRSAALRIYDSVRVADAPHQVRAAGLRGAILLRGTDGVPILVQAIRGDDFTQFDAALRAAMEMRHTLVTMALVNNMTGLSSDKKQVVLQILADRGDVLALTAVTEAVRAGDRNVRLAAIRACARFGNPAPAGELRRAMSDPDKDIARAAQESFASLPGREIDDAVLAMLASGPGAQRLTAMDLAVRRRMITALPVLYKAAGDSDTQVRTTAIRKIGEISGPGDLPAVLNLLTGVSKPEDLEAAEQALGTVAMKATNRDEAVQVLSAPFITAQPPQKVALLRVLTGLGGSSALKLVRSAVKDSNPEIQSAAVRALSSWSSPEAAPDLLEIARSSQNATDRMVALRGYLGMAGQSEQQSEEQRLALCRQVADLVQKPEEKRMLLAALGTVNSPDSIGLIAPYLGDEAVKEEAATAVVGISEKVLKKPDAAKSASALVPALTSVSKASSNAGLVDKAKKLLQEASAKSGGA
jgi:HEAT repeat protein